MIKKKWIWGITIAVVLTLMVGMDLYKSRTEEKPPSPVISIGNKEVPAILGPFRWNADLMNDIEKDELLKDVSPTGINPLHDLTVTFSGEEPTNLSVMMMDLNYYEEYHLFEGDYVEGQPISLPNEPGEIELTIHAEWPGGKTGTYYLSLEREQVVSYQTLMSEEKDTYSLYHIYSPGSPDPFMNTALGTGAIPFTRWMGSEGLEFAQSEYPDLNITEVPSFFVFNDRELLFKTNSVEELTKFFEASYEPKPVNLLGHIFEIDKNSKIINLDGKRLYVEDISDLKVGQEVEANVTFHSLSNLLKAEVHNLSVQKQPHDVLLAEGWRPTSPEKYSVLGIGEDVFLEPLLNPTQTELFKDVDTHILSNMFDLSLLTNSYVVYNHEGAVFITQQFDDLVQYLKENPL